MRRGSCTAIGLDVVRIGFAALATLASAPPSAAGAEKSGAEAIIASQQQQATANVARIDRMVREGAREFDVARRTQSISWVNCVNESLSAMKELQRLAHSNLLAMAEAAARRDRRGVEHEYVKISIAFNKTEELYGQLQGCGGPAAEPIMDGRPYIDKRISPPSIAPTSPLYFRPPRDREGYDVIHDNTFQRTSSAPLSTLSIDVDTAAYANARRFIENGRLPPADAVRIEELVNYFDYGYGAPGPDRPLAVHTETTAAPWHPGHQLLRIALQARRIQTHALPPGNLVFLLDVSGSMDSPAKLPLVVRSFGLLVDQLRPQDRVAIVVYAGAAGLVLPSTSGERKETIKSALAGLNAGGSTAGAEGLVLAYRVARRSFVEGGNNRVIIATDGDFNVGVSSDGELVRLIEEQRQAGVYLSVLGFGAGNYQDAKMQKLASLGNGTHAYIDGLHEARKVLVGEMGATVVTVARDVKVQVEFNPLKVASYRLIGYVNRKLEARDFADDRKDAGELGAGHATTVLYEIVPAVSGGRRSNGGGLRYQDHMPSKVAREGGELASVKLRFKPPEKSDSVLLVHRIAAGHRPLHAASDGLRFAAAVAQFGMLLRDSEHKGVASWRSTSALARGALGRDPHGHRHAFVALVSRAAALARSPAVARAPSR